MNKIFSGQLASFELFLERITDLVLFLKLLPTRLIGTAAIAATLGVRTVATKSIRHVDAGDAAANADRFSAGGEFAILAVVTDDRIDSQQPVLVLAFGVGASAVGIDNFNQLSRLLFDPIAAGAHTNTAVSAFFTRSFRRGHIPTLLDGNAHFARTVVHKV